MAESKGEEKRINPEAEAVVEGAEGLLSEHERRRQEFLDTTEEHFEKHRFWRERQEELLAARKGEKWAKTEEMEGREEEEEPMDAESLQAALLEDKAELEAVEKHLKEISQNLDRERTRVADACRNGDIAAAEAAAEKVYDQARLGSYVLAHIGALLRRSRRHAEKYHNLTVVAAGFDQKEYPLVGADFFNDPFRKRINELYYLVEDIEKKGRWYAWRHRRQTTVLRQERDALMNLQRELRISRRVVTDTESYSWGDFLGYRDDGMIKKAASQVGLVADTHLNALAGHEVDESMFEINEQGDSEKEFRRFLDGLVTERAEAGLRAHETHNQTSYFNAQRDGNFLSLKGNLNQWARYIVSRGREWQEFCAAVRGKEYSAEQIDMADEHVSDEFIRQFAEGKLAASSLGEYRNSQTLPVELMIAMAGSGGVGLQRMPELREQDEEVLNRIGLVGVIPAAKIIGNRESWIAASGQLYEHLLQHGGVAAKHWLVQQKKIAQVLPMEQVSRAAVHFLSQPENSQEYGTLLSSLCDMSGEHYEMPDKLARACGHAQAIVDQYNSLDPEAKPIVDKFSTQAINQLARRRDEKSRILLQSLLQNPVVQDGILRTQFPKGRLAELTPEDYAAFRTVIGDLVDDLAQRADVGEFVWMYVDANSENSVLSQLAEACLVSEGAGSSFYRQLRYFETLYRDMAEKIGILPRIERGAYVPIDYSTFDAEQRFADNMVKIAGGGPLFKEFCKWFDGLEDTDQQRRIAGFAAGSLRADDLALPEDQRKRGLTPEETEKFHQAFLQYKEKSYWEDNGPAVDNNPFSRRVTLQLLARQPEKVGLLQQLQQRAPLLCEKDNKAVFERVMRAGELALQDESDLDFFNSLLGAHGNVGRDLIDQYINCLEAGVITSRDKAVVPDYLQHFRFLGPEMLRGFMRAKGAGPAELEQYVRHLRSVAEGMISSKPLPAADRERPYYPELIRSVYQNNSGQWTTYENNATCEDRLGDLAGFTIRDRYEIDLLSAGSVTVREGQELDKAAMQRMEGLVYAVAEELKTHDFDPEKMQAAFLQRVDGLLEKMREAGGFADVDMSVAESVEEKLSLLLCEHLYGSQQLSDAELKNLFITYEFAHFEDIRDYIRGTSDRVAGAGNKDYALLCELHTFFADRLKEVNRKLVRAAFENEHLQPAMGEYFRKHSTRAQAEQRQQRVARARPEQLGLSDGFVQQIRRTLQQKFGRDRQWSDAQVARFVHLYESLAQGMTEKKSRTSEKSAAAFYGQLKSQREKTMVALRDLVGAEFDPREFHLGEVDLRTLLEEEKNIAAGEYQPEQFAAYTAQRFLGVFQVELDTIDGELKKFSSESGHGRQVLHGYFAKTRETANARMVGGVCVCGDNPGQEKRAQCQWDLPNYFELVLQDPETGRCQGTNLLHYFTDAHGKKILAASLNPSSTYLYSVDEVALFQGIKKCLEQFALANNFDMIVLSTNKGIRTNRTGGTFEKTMDAAIAAVGKKYSFVEPQQFSFRPKYEIKDMDVIWEKT